MTTEITQALLDFERGDDGAFDQLVSLIYGDLHRLARIQLAKRKGRDLQTTALVHELYLKLVDRNNASWTGRNHFYAACATAMRNIIIDSARAARRQKRGGGDADLTLIETLLPGASQDVDFLLSVEQALCALAAKRRELAQVFELRFFGGYSAAEVADILDVSKRSAERAWKRASAWIHAATKGEEDQ